MNPLTSGSKIAVAPVAPVEAIRAVVFSLRPRRRSFTYRNGVLDHNVDKPLYFPLRPLKTGWFTNSSWEWLGFRFAAKKQRATWAEVEAVIVPDMRTVEDWPINRRELDDDGMPCANVSGYSRRRSD